MKDKILYWTEHRDGWIDQDGQKWIVDTSSVRQSERARRYETIRKLTPRQYAEIWRRNLNGENFDDMIDALAAMPNEKS